MATAIRADQMYFEQFTCVNSVSPIVRSFELLNNTLSNFLSLFTPHGPDSAQDRPSPDKQQLTIRWESRAQRRGGISYNTDSLKICQDMFRNI